MPHVTIEKSKQEQKTEMVEVFSIKTYKEGKMSSPYHKYIIQTI